MRGPRPSGDRRAVRGRSRLAACLALLGVLSSAVPAAAQATPPRSAETAEPGAPVVERNLVIRGSTDTAEIQPLVESFRKQHPEIEVSYEKVTSTLLYDTFLEAAASGGPMPDIVWSAAMDLQIKLVNDGYAARYIPRDPASLPSWAVWRNEAYGVTVEPIVFAYNRRLLPEDRVPRSHAELTRALTEHPELWKGKVAAYDPERSGVGSLILAQDVAITPRSWDLVGALGQVGAKLYTRSETMLDRVASGESIFAYGVFGAYALERAKRDPQVGIVLPADYTLLLARIAFVAKAAPHPRAARLFLDHMLSAEGQADLASRSLTPVRSDRRRPDDPVTRAPNPRPIPVGPELLANLDQVGRARMLRLWRRVTEGRPPPGKDRNPAATGP